MQYLKEEIKNRIMKAALKEFEEKGFQKASMSGISSEAGVATGNIYRYFKNKDELFNEMIEPVYNSFTALIMDLNGEVDSLSADDPDTKSIVQALMELYLKYQPEFVIMLEKSEGSRFENTKDRLIRVVHARLAKELLPMSSQCAIVLNDSFLYVFAATLMEGMLIVLKSSSTKDEKEMLINRLLVFYFYGLHERLS